MWGGNSEPPSRGRGWGKDATGGSRSATTATSGARRRKGNPWKQTGLAKGEAKVAVPEELMGTTPALVTAGDLGAKRAPAAVPKQKQDDIYANLVDMGGSGVEARVCF